MEYHHTTHRPRGTHPHRAAITPQPEGSPVNEYLWRSTAGFGIEHIRVTDDHPEWTVIDSMLIRIHDHRIYRGGFTLVVDKKWKTLELRAMMENEPGQMMAVHLLADGKGNWTDADGRAISRFDGIFDVDIPWSAVSSSQVIHRVTLAPGDDRPVRVVHLDLPSLELSVQRHTYTRQDATHVARRRSNDDTACLTIDAEGWLTDEPDAMIREFPPAS